MHAARRRAPTRLGAVGHRQRRSSILGMRLDQAHHILAWPTAELDPPRLAVQGQVRHVIMTIGTKAALDGTLGREAARERDRERLVKELAPRFSELWPAPPTRPPST